MNENPIILSIVDQILDVCNPYRIILFNKKFDLWENLISFKVCIIVPNDTDVPELECSLYLELDSEIPFDMLIYREKEWIDLIEDNTSFANKILKSGVVLYELQV